MTDICYKYVAVIPTYNDRENIEKMLDAVYQPNIALVAGASKCLVGLP